MTEEMTKREQEVPQEPAKPNGETTTPANGELDSASPDLFDQLQRVTGERDEYLDQLQRSRAEFINFRRRTEQERSMLRQLVTRDVLAQFLPVVDDIQRALAAMPEAERESGWVKGVAMIETKLTGILDRAGVTPVAALGLSFDPSIHEAVATEPDTDGSTVVEVYQPGYCIRDLLLRPAMVKTGASNPDVTPVERGDSANGQEPSEPTDR
ncbi:MAG: nucleotide exchange factor GrpE [Chloroflexia bacterium]|nr:nucleotide exchange factor GrpE [Chloroflexia bacterium]